MGTQRKGTSSPRKKGHRKRHRSHEEMKKALADLKDMMARHGYLSSDEVDSDYDEKRYKRVRRSRSRQRREHSCRLEHHDRDQGKQINWQPSGTTIYESAVKSHRGSSSSDALVNTSDETIQLDLSTNSSDHARVHTRSSDEFVNHVLSEYRDQSRGCDIEHNPVTRDSQSHSRPRGSRPLPPPPAASGVQRTMERIKEAESSRAHMYDVSGNDPLTPKHNDQEFTQDPIEILNEGFAHSMMVDEQFMFVAAHIDSSLHQKIAKGEYVKFSRLIARDKVDMDDETRMEMVNHDGQPMWVPAEKDFTTISNFFKWEQAF